MVLPPCWSVLHTPHVVISLELELIICKFQRGPVDYGR